MSVRTGSHALLDLPLIIDQAFETSHHVRIHLALVVHEPGAFLCRGRVTGYGQSMVQVTPAEVHLIASVCLEGLVLQLFIVYELRLVDQDMVERQSVACTLAVL